MPNQTRTSDIPSSWRRLSAHFIDEIILTIVCLPFFLQLVFRMQATGEVSVHWALIAYFIIARLAYDILSLYYFGATVGKRAMGLKVVSRREGVADSKALTFWQCAVRGLGMRLAYFFSWAPYVFALSRYDRTHLLDWMAGTRVIQHVGQWRRMKVYPVWTALFVLYFAWQGLTVANTQISEIEWRKPDVFVSPDIVPVYLDLAEEE